MGRKGRELELLVEKLEKFGLPNGSVIKSPDSIPHNVTGKPREVDVSIRYSIGNNPILIIIECRDRHSSNEDITWIEQLKSKKEGIKADKFIAVSSEGFSKTAKEYASFYGIETRTIESLSKDNICKNPKHKAKIVYDRLHFLDCKINRDVLKKGIDKKGIKCIKPEIEKYYSTHTKDKQFLIQIDKYELDFWVSMNFLMYSAIKTSFPDLVIPTDGTKFRLKFSANYNNEGYTLKIVNPEMGILNNSLIFDIYYDVIVWKDLERWPLSKVTNYSNEDGNLKAEYIYEKIEAKEAKRVIRYIDFINQKQYYEGLGIEAKNEIEIKPRMER